MKLPIIIVMMMVALASGLQRSSYAVSRKQAKLDSLLYSACDKLDSVAVRKLLKAGANIFGEVYRGYSTVELAFIMEPPEFEMLVRCGAKITRPTPKGTSLLHLVSLREEDLGQTPARLTDAQLATLLASKNDVNAVSSSGQTPLHSAASNGNIELVRQLVERGANVNARDTNGATPLHFSSRNALNKLRPKDWIICSFGWEQRERERINTLEGRKAIVRYLIEHGADVNAIDNHQNLPLHWYHDGCDEFVKLALPRGMRLDVINDENESVLHVCAAASEDGSAVAALIAAGMDINARGEYGQTPLHYTLRHNRVAVVRALLAAGADLSIQDQFGRTAYYEAVESWQRPEIAALLREAGAELYEPPPPELSDYQKMIDEIQKMRKEQTPKEPTELDKVMEEVEKLRK